MGNLDAFVYKEDGNIMLPRFYSASIGLGRLGYNVFHIDKRAIETLEFESSNIFVGPKEFVSYALARLGLDSPQDFDYPEKLQEFLGRKMFITTLGEVRRHAGSDDGFRFIKPVKNKKLFVGHPISCFRDLIPTSDFPSTLEVWCSDFIDIVSEYRFYIHDDRIIGSSHYSGSPKYLYDYSIIDSAVFKMTKDKGRPKAYCLDFGVTNEGATILIEGKDGYDFEPYSLSPEKQASMHEDRWLQIVGKR